MFKKIIIQLFFILFTVIQSNCMETESQPLLPSNIELTKAVFRGDIRAQDRLLTSRESVLDFLVAIFIKSTLTPQNPETARPLSSPTPAPPMTQIIAKNTSINTEEPLGGLSDEELSRLINQEKTLLNDLFIQIKRNQLKSRIVRRTERYLSFDDTTSIETIFFNIRVKNLISMPDFWIYGQIISRWFGENALNAGNRAITNSLELAAQLCDCACCSRCV